MHYEIATITAFLGGEEVTDEWYAQSPEEAVRFARNAYEYRSEDIRSITVASVQEETRPCFKCDFEAMPERPVVREFVTARRQDPTAAYVLTCGHTVIDL